MLRSFIERNLVCPYCGASSLQFSDEATSSFYEEPGLISVENIDKIVNDTISEVLVMECLNCKEKVPGTFKEFEAQVRKTFTKLTCEALMGGKVAVPKSIDPTKRTLIYCGKCGGYDGKGSCTRKIFNECELKRIPSL